MRMPNLIVVFIKYKFETDKIVAAPVVEQLRALFLDHSIISPLCPKWVRAPLWPYVRQAKFCLRVCQVFLARLHEVHRDIVVTSVVPVYVYIYVCVPVTLSVKVFL